jgi:hypothetical protein
MKNAVADYIADKLSDTEKNKDNPISATYHLLENKKDNLEVDRLFYQNINIETIKNNINKEHVREEFQKIIP